MKNTEDIRKNYIFKEKIGQGSFGIVYKAIHKSLGEIRAIKLIDKTSVDPSKISKLLQEVDILKTLVISFNNKGSSKHCQIIRILLGFKILLYGY